MPGEYRFNQDAYDYLTAYKDTEWLIAALKIRKDPVFQTQDPQKTFLEELGHLTSTQIRLLTEAGLFASLIEHGVPKNLNIHSDDAPHSKYSNSRFAGYMKVRRRRTRKFIMN